MAASPDSLQERVVRRFGKGPNIRLEHRTHLLQREFIFTRGVGGNAVGGHPELKSAHVGVIRREENADICGHASKDQSPGAEVAQEQVEGGGMKAGVLGFNYKVIVAVRRQLFHDLATAAF